MTKLVTMSEKNESGELEVFYPQTHVDGVVGLNDYIQAKEDATRSKTLFSGAANAVSATRYTLTETIDNFDAIRITYSGAGTTNIQETFKKTTNVTLVRSNQSDTGTSTTFWLYECGLDFAGKTYFTIVRDNTIKQSNSVTTPTANANEFTISYVEGLRY
ncbi:hypothetical protein AOA01_00360 [Listeria monocytogenes]|uniref:hypothetical protein n=1 Tax=Listeria monocytogenes TaxID=1639 RepID=UPI000775F61E|nr:hypothetical protein [Listeria monocytogenes]EAF5877630.1 hypothetical protein [Listeria monocytogenes]EKZ4877809.1 hypothetical protein [Listeria monocytogenes]KXS65744.1 hypothetical protein AWJ02_01430 [Listeria monocytogenes]KXW92899.1 hypothetical protein AWJ00_08185 [Listeria monocytogenes]